MYSIISFLDAEADAKVKQLRAVLMSQHAFLRDALMLEPHISWLTSDELDVHSVGGKLTRMTQTLRPFYLETTGFGIFSGSKPVLYLPVIKTGALSKFHAELWDLLTDELNLSNRLYNPDQWLPHISVFYFEKDEAEALGCALADLVTMDFQLHFTVDHLKIAYYRDEQYGLQSEHYFKGQSGL